MFKRIKEIKIHLLIITFIVGIFFGLNLSGQSKAEEPVHKYLDYFHEVYQAITTSYVEVPDNKEMFYGAIRGMINSLNDPYSRFLDESAFNVLKEETTGKFVGVGIEITIRDGEIVVISPIEDTPAMRAGIVSEDVIIKVNDVLTKGKGLEDIIKMIKGLPNTKVKLTVRREGYDAPLDFNVERVPIKIETVSYGIIKGYDRIGYLKVKVFSSDTSRDIEEALKDFNRKGIDKMVVDLRWNPGGLLDKAIKISDFFLKKGEVIVSTRGREGSGDISEFRSEMEPLYKGKLVVLVNSGSASASEIFSGAIKDNKRGELVGTKTFGKGLVQKSFNLNDNIGFTLTIAKYYTPSGISIQGKGIIPDYVVQAEQISKEDLKTINSINKEKIPELFVKEHRDYNDENKLIFRKLLKEKNLSVSDENADFLLKKEIYKYAKRPLYDLEFDRQLNEAIRIVNISKGKS